MINKFVSYISLLPVAAMVFMFMAGCTAPNKGDSELEFYFDRAGGTVNGPFGVKMVIPADAVVNSCDAVMIFSKSAPTPQPGGNELTITTWLSLDDSCDPLLKPATLIMPLSASAQNPKGMFSAKPSGGWTMIPALTNDDGLVWMEIDKSGYYTFISEE